MDRVPWDSCFSMMRGNAGPPSAVGGLEGIDKRVGSWGKKVKVKAHGPRSMGLLFFNDER